MSRCSLRVWATSRSAGPIGLPLAVRSVSVNSMGSSFAGGCLDSRVITTGERTATTGMNCGLAGSQNSSTPFPSIRKSMWFTLEPVGSRRTTT